jgi:hypothetical protein
MSKERNTLNHVGYIIFKFQYVFFFFQMECTILQYELQKVKPSDQLQSMENADDKEKTTR